MECSRVKMVKDNFNQMESKTSLRLIDGGREGEEDGDEYILVLATVQCTLLDRSIDGSLDGSIEG